MSKLTESDKYYSLGGGSPAKSKSFDTALNVFFAREFPQTGGPLVRPLIVDEVKKMVGTYYPLTSEMKMGQIMWVGVAKEEKQSYGKRIENTKFVPVILDLCSSSDMDAVFKKKKKRETKKQKGLRRGFFAEQVDQGLFCAGTPDLNKGITTQVVGADFTRVNNSQDD